MGEWKGDKANINRNGRPKKGETLTDILKQYAETIDADFEDSTLSRKEALSQQLWTMALNGDLSAMKYIFDRIDGTPKQTIETQSAKEGEWLDLAKELLYEPEQETETDS